MANDDHSPGPAAQASPRPALVVLTYQALRAEIKTFDTDVAALTRHAAPGLVEQFGVGPEIASSLLIAVEDNPGRMVSEAAFANLTGVAPIQASSGKTKREAIRCLKRYLARDVYRHLRHAATARGQPGLAV